MAAPEAVTKDESFISSQLASYLVPVCCALLEADANAARADLKRPAAQEVLQDFAAAADATNSIHIQRTIDCSSSDGGHAEAMQRLVVHREMPRCDGGSFVTVIKRTPGPLQHDLPLRSQLHIMTFSGDAATDGAGSSTSTTTTSNSGILSALHQFTRHALLPAVTPRSSSNGENGVGTNDGDEGGDGGGGGSGGGAALRAVRQRVKELDVALAQCQRRMELPVVTLAPPHGLESASAAVAAGSPLDIDALGLASKVSDDAFLNTLQTIVGGWVRDVQRVSALAAVAPFPESAVEEVELWRGLSDALHAARSQLEGPAVQVSASAGE